MTGTQKNHCMDHIISPSSYSNYIVIVLLGCVLSRFLMQQFSSAVCWPLGSPICFQGIYKFKPIFIKIGCDCFSFFTVDIYKKSAKSVVDKSTDTLTQNKQWPQSVLVSIFISTLHTSSKISQFYLWMPWIKQHKLVILLNPEPLSIIANIQCGKIWRVEQLCWILKNILFEKLGDWV